MGHLEKSRAPSPERPESQEMKVFLLGRDRYGIRIQTADSPEPKYLKIQTTSHIIRWEAEEETVEYQDDEGNLREWQNILITFTDHRNGNQGRFRIEPNGDYVWERNPKDGGEILEGYRFSTIEGKNGLKGKNGLIGYELIKTKKKRKKNMATGNWQVDPFAGDYFGKDKEKQPIKGDPFTGDYFGKDKEKRPIKGDPFAGDQFPK